MRCPLAEAMHVISWPGKIGLTNYEHWSVEEKKGGWEENTALWDKFKEAVSWI
jgi:hypothetical protein